MWKVTASSFFRLTPRILDLGFAHLSSLPLWNLAEPLMEDLVEEVRESSSAAVLDGLDIVYVLRVPTHKIMRTSLGVAPPAGLDFHGPRAAGQPARRRTAKPPGHPAPAAPHRPHRHRPAHPLLERIRQARTQGWCLVNQELEEGLISIAAPLTNRLGQTGGSPQHQRPGQPHQRRADAANLLPPLLRAAQTISRLMGAPRR